MNTGAAVLTSAPTGGLSRATGVRGDAKAAGGIAFAPAFQSAVKDLAAASVPAVSGSAAAVPGGTVPGTTGAGAAVPGTVVRAASVAGSAVTAPSDAATDLTVLQRQDTGSDAPLNSLLSTLESGGQRKAAELSGVETPVTAMMEGSASPAQAVISTGTTTPAGMPAALPEADEVVSGTLPGAGEMPAPAGAMPNGLSALSIPAQPGMPARSGTILSGQAATPAQSTFPVHSTQPSQAGFPTESLPGIHTGAAVQPGFAGRWLSSSDGGAARAGSAASAGMPVPGATAPGTAGLGPTVGAIAAGTAATIAAPTAATAPTDMTTSANAPASSGMMTAQSPVPVVVPDTAASPAQSPGANALSNAQPVPLQAVAHTASVAQAPPAPHAPSVPLSTQMFQPVFSLAASEPGEYLVTVNVAPENLGPVTVRAQVSAEGMRVELFAPSDIGRDALRSVLADLRRELAGSGMNTSLDVSSHNNPNASAEETANPGREGERRERPAPESGAPPGWDEARQPGAGEKPTEPDQQAPRFWTTSTIDLIA